MDVVVITPTTGSPDLQRAMDSVAAQTYSRIEHHVVFDGEHFASRRERFKWGRQKQVVVPHNTGANGFNGHRIYAGYGLMVNADVVVFLDQDCFFAPNHVETLVKTLDQLKVDWCFSLRNIYSAEGQYLMQDNCENLGMWPAWDAARPGSRPLVDTNCYAIRRHCLPAIAEAWIEPWTGDRAIYVALQGRYPHYACTGEYTSQYVLGGNDRSVQQGYFEQGNAVMQQRYPDGFPWQNQVVLHQPKAAQG